eukprot:TRINITY_DN63_c0_g1_i1.p1 TRINITY_DN63_c0_g1~~TRINITY_DN63_c0_g1_i1.p1  ORF type:complete len:405 (-),score=118.64 TRINITY_DN63_c0_g1_i1:343-1557(-)
MAAKIDPTQVTLLRQFVQIVSAKPEMLHLPELSFFKDWLKSLGATMPEPEPEPKPESKPEPKPESTKEEGMDSSSPKGATKEPEKPAPVSESSSELEESPESDLELDSTDLVPEDVIENQPMGDPEKEVSEEDIDRAGELRSEAMAKSSDGDIEGAVATFTEAIQLNPSSALLYAKRASLYVKLSRPNAAIKDTTEAIKLNPDSAQGYKWRGRAHSLLGHWADAAHDLQTALKLDYDDDANDWLKLIKSKSDRIREHTQKQERKSREREVYMKKKRVKRARKQYESDKKADEERFKSMPHGSGGMGGKPGGMPSGMQDIFNDPELMELMRDEEVMKAFQESASNPANLAKYANNPRVMKAMQKMQEKMGGLGGMGGMGGMEEGTMPMGAGPMGGFGGMDDDGPD